MATLTAYSSADDSVLSYTGIGATLYSNAREGTGYFTAPYDGGAFQRNWAGQSRGTLNDYYVHQAFLKFDTSSLGAVARVTGATLYLTAYLDQSDADFEMEVRGPHDWGAAVDSGDFVPGSSLSSIPLLGSYSSADGWVPLTEYAIPLDVDGINQLGTTYMVLASDQQRLNSPPTYDTKERLLFYASSYTGTSRDPRLEVTYEIPTLYSKTATFDAALATRKTKGVTFDAELMALLTKTATLDAALANPLSAMATLDAALANVRAVTATLDAVLVPEGEEQVYATFDAELMALLTKTATFDAALGGPATATATFDAAPQSWSTAVATFDAYLYHLPTEAPGRASAANAPRPDLGGASTPATERGHAG